ncbi:MAG TPA: autotransporter-associated beta strand repeat-containing protein [Opitutus sp.]|nr:autotransporter-associated beta strand repeat-containing protein [Opitutus sp.]
MTVDNLTLDGGTLHSTATLTLDPNRGITLTENGGSFDTEVSTQLTVAGPITGPGALAKYGSGTLVLSGNTDNYSGSTTISGGRLQLADDNVLPSTTSVNLTASGAELDLYDHSQSVKSLAGVTGSTVVFNTDGSLALSGNSSTTFAGSFTGDATTSITKTGSGTLTLSGDNSDFSGSLTVDAGTVQLSSDTARGTGDWTFYNSSVLKLTFTNALGASSGLTTLYDNSQINAHVGGAISGGTQEFYDSSSLQVTSSGAITGGEQHFHGDSLLKAGKSGSITGASGDSKQFFTDTATLVASTAGAITGGTQDFSTNGEYLSSYFDGHHDLPPGDTFGEILTAATSGDVTDFLNATAHLTVNGNWNATSGPAIGGDSMQCFSGYSSLQANHANAVGGGTQFFADDTHLRASTTNAVTGGTQYFSGSSFLWATAENAVNGADSSSFQEYFSNSAGVYASHTGAIGAVTLNLRDDSFVKLGADDALSASTEIYFDGSGSGAGGKLILDGHDTTVGEISSGFSQAGSIYNGSTSSGAVLTVDTDSESNSTFSGTISDAAPEETPVSHGGGIHGLSLDSEVGTLALVKAGTGNLTLTGANTYSGGTAIAEGLLIVSGSGASIYHPDADVIVGSAGTSHETSGPHARDLSLASLFITNGGKVTSANGFVAPNSSTIGASQVDGACSSWTLTDSLVIGDSGYGSLVLTSGGTVTIGDGDGTLTLASSSGSSGIISIGLSDEGDSAPAESAGYLKAATITTGAGFGTVLLAGTGSATNPYYLTSDGTSEGSPVKISGPTHVSNASGVNILNRDNDYTGGTDVSGGTLVAQSDNALGEGTVHLMNEASLVFDTANPQIGGLDDSTDEDKAFVTSDTGALFLTTAVETLTITESDRDRFSGPIMGYDPLNESNPFTTTSATLIKDGSGMLVLAGDNSALNGEIHINAGLLVADNKDASEYNIDHQPLGTGAITVNPSGILGLADGVLLTNNVTLSGSAGQRAAIAGFGTIAPIGQSLVIADNDVISPGAKLDPSRGLNHGSNAAPVGTLHIGFDEGEIHSPTTVTFSSGGVYDWAVQGNTSDLVDITGSLVFDYSGGPFIFRVSSYNSDGHIAAFDTSAAPAQPWVVLTTTGGISSFDSSKISFLTDSGSFLTGLNGGAFSLNLSEDGNDLLLNFNPAAVPEPSTWALLLCGLAALGLFARRGMLRRKS